MLKCDFCPKTIQVARNLTISFNPQPTNRGEVTPRYSSIQKDLCNDCARRLENAIKRLLDQPLPLMPKKATPKEERKTKAKTAANSASTPTV